MWFLCVLCVLGGCLGFGFCGCFRMFGVLVLVCVFVGGILGLFLLFCVCFAVLGFRMVVWVVLGLVVCLFVLLFICFVFCLFILLL